MIYGSCVNFHVNMLDSQCSSECYFKYIYVHIYKQIYIYKYWPLHTICFIACQRKICPCCQTFERIWYVYNIYKYICIYVKQNLCFLSAFLVFIVGGAQKCRKTAILLCCLRFLNIFENVYRNTYIHIY